MRGLAKSVLVAILVSVCIMMFTNLVFFFPWYMTLVVETFNLSQAAASDNYIKQSYYDDALDRMRNRPIYRDKAEDIRIAVTNESGYSAIGGDDEEAYAALTEWEKPYRQRGKSVTVTVSAVYPLKVTLWGKKYEQEIPASFSLTTIGLKHYKDLDFYFD
ncbi:hypothetical protein MUG84_08720 [Paenibacillus sp. KQZ6P-2]|uniref:Uncharacterized protein n=1 Tax=Paenibacillus mangrovi TaxID=2931978 RepID=A0A9X1WU15_9BACL|nr:hypothetical protein [Paenibacillus mangrovi]MCJ8011824.1 hypothetical protein [Paenibacillus mangrovi]